MYLLKRKIIQDGNNIGNEVGVRIGFRVVWFAAFPMAPRINEDELIGGFEGRDKARALPSGPVAGKTVHEHQGRALTLNLVIDRYSVIVGDWHDDSSPRKNLHLWFYLSMGLGGIGTAVPSVFFRTQKRSPCTALRRK